MIRRASWLVLALALVAMGLCALRAAHALDERLYERQYVVARQWCPLVEIKRNEFWEWCPIGMSPGDS